MATVKEIVFEHHKKDDGTYNVKIRLWHKGNSKYINTNYYVTDKQIRKDFTIKDQTVLAEVTADLAKYRKKLNTLGSKANSMSRDQLADYLTGDENNSEIDFIDFGKKYIEQLKKDGRDKSAGNARTVINSLKDFFKTDVVYASDINLKFLYKFEAFLRTERKQVRSNRAGITLTIKKKGLGDAGIYGYMRDLRTLFNEAKSRFNDEETGVIRIPHYPFAKYKVGTPPPPVKRNMTIDDLISIRDLEGLPPGGRAEMARDILMISFYMCGMNAKDMYNYGNYKGGRIEYNRSKTKGKRKDKAFISINVPDVAKPLIEKYFGRINKRYATPDGFNAALKKGFEQIEKALPKLAAKLPRRLGTYFARHTFGNAARNICRFPKDDVAQAMNHVDNSTKTTDAYIDVNWDIVDEVQSGVVGLLLAKSES